jgi:hypothetical protein
MNCPELERLIQFAYHLLEQEEVAEIASHVGDCERCRELVAGYQRLDKVMDEWKVGEPSPWFDARVRHAVEGSAAVRKSRVFWGLGWGKGLALASLIVLVVAGVTWMSHRHRATPSVATVSSPPPAPQKPAETPAVVAQAKPVSIKPALTRQATPKPVVEPEAESSEREDSGSSVNDDDLLANFDVLSELHKGTGQVEN